MTKREELEDCKNGVGCLGRSKDEEPIFILCGRDPIAADVVFAWATRYEQAHLDAGTFNGVRRAKYLEALEQAEKMRRYALGIL